MLKPSEKDPGAAMMLAELALEAGEREGGVRLSPLVLVLFQLLLEGQAIG